MKRRTFVIAGLVGLSGLTAWQTFKTNAEGTIEMVVRRRLDYLKLDAEGVRRFAHDLAALHVVSSSRMHLLSGLRPLYARFALSSGDNALARLLRHGEDRIVGSYLISTDFFLNHSDESRTVMYLGLLDPRRACGNPFARRPA